MGKRKRIAAEARKSALQPLAFARLNDCPTSPRKMRLVADLIRGKKVDHALNILKFSTKEASGRLEKLLLSAINNWQAKNESLRIEDQDLFVSEVYVDGGTMLKRLRTAPQGRGYRIRKRSNHVTLILGNGIEGTETAPAVEQAAEAPAPEETATESTEATPTKKPAAKKSSRKAKPGDRTKAAGSTTKE